MSTRLNEVLDHDEAAFLRLVLDAVSDCLVVVDTEGRILLINRPYCDLLGGEPEDFLGRHVRDAISPSSHLADVAQGAPHTVGSRLVVRGREIVTRQVPIGMGGEIVGALGVALFADSKMAESTLRQLTGDPLVLATDQTRWHARYSLDDLVGRGSNMEKLKAQIRQAGRSAYPVLIHGETGVGKELVAQSIHRISNRAGRPFVWLNCATIPDELVASELFGYEGGSFTGANARGGRGKIEMASGGTLFLDEIGDMPLHAQAALLRFLQEGEITRVGGTRPIKVDARVVSASHKNLQELVRKGLFREDLLYRLRVLSIDVPPLRERNDLDLLAAHLLARVRIEMNMARLSLSERAVSQIRSCSWPGNVRELQATLQRAAVALPDGEFEIPGFDDLPTGSSAGTDAVLRSGEAGQTSVGGAAGTGRASTLSEAVTLAERSAVLQALAACNGNRSEAARRLQIDRASLYKRLRAWGM